MNTVSVPLPDFMVQGIEDLVNKGIMPNKSECIRQAVRLYLEEQAVSAILKAKTEPNLEGDLDELARNM